MVGLMGMLQGEMQELETLTENEVWIKGGEPKPRARPILGLGLA